jgi:hypothetical protein
MPDGFVTPGAQSTSPSTRWKCCTHICRRVSTSGTARSTAGASGEVTALSSRIPSVPIRRPTSFRLAGALGNRDSSARVA